MQVCINTCPACRFCTGPEMNYSSVASISAISERRVQKLCEGNRIPGVVKFGSVWLIPKDAEKPKDGKTILSNVGNGKLSIRSAQTTVDFFEFVCYNTLDNRSYAFKNCRKRE